MEHKQESRFIIDRFGGQMISYNINTPQSLLAQVKKLNFEDPQCLTMVIANLLACRKKNNYIIYSRSNAVRARGKKRITDGRVIKCARFLFEKGWIFNIIGERSPYIHLRRPSKMIPTEKFKEDWPLDQDLQDFYLKNLLNKNKVIILRDKNKNEKNFTNTEFTEKMAQKVRKMNILNEFSKITNEDDEILANSYVRIFNESFDRGGRFYRADILGIPNRLKNDRIKVKIDGEPVVEIDYGNLHFRIAAAKNNVKELLGPVDLYSAILDDEENAVNRLIVKRGVNIMFNSKTKTAAMRAIMLEINNLSPEEKMIYNLGSGKNVFDLIIKNYSQLEKMFCKNDSYGLFLQNEESNLADRIINDFVDQGFPILPIHDSFIVKLKHKDLLGSLMGNTFRERYKENCEVPVSAKYFQGESFVKEKYLV